MIPAIFFVDDDGNVYLVDAANNRLIVTDPNYKLAFTITDFINDQGIPDSFTNPSGVFATDTSIYVCDTDANRIVVFNRDGSFKRFSANLQALCLERKPSINRSPLRLTNMTGFLSFLLRRIKA